MRAHGRSNKLAAAQLHNFTHSLPAEVNAAAFHIFQPPTCAYFLPWYQSLTKVSLYLSLLCVRRPALGSRVTVRASAPSALLSPSLTSSRTPSDAEPQRYCTHPHLDTSKQWIVASERHHSK